jgi:hypothetical protein
MLGMTLALSLTGLTLAGGNGPLGTGTAEAATRTYWGVKFNWQETKVIASADAFNARNIMRRAGLPGAVVAVLRWHYIEAARFSVFQGRCVGITWVGSAVPGQRC